jgi:tetratricopeptide (TPR) repeat protein
MRTAFLITTVLLALSAPPALAQVTPPAQGASTLTPMQINWRLCMRSDPSTTLAQATGACSAIIETGQETPGNMAIAYFNRANAAITTNPRQAEGDYSQAIALGYANENVYYGRAIARDALAKYQDALADYTQALSINANFADARANRGNVYQYGLQDYDNAIADYTAAIALADNPIYRGNRGNAYQYGKHDLANAVADYDRAVELAPSYASAYVDRGNAHATLHENDAAISDYQHALTLEPHSALAHLDLGNLYNDLGQRDQAIAEWSAAIAADPREAAALGNRAAAYAQSERLDLAATDYDAALAIRPDATDFFGRGKVRMLQSQTLPGAISDFDEAAALDAGNVDYKAYACMARAMAGTELDAARTLCDAALAGASDAQHAQFLTFRGLVNLKQERWQDAWNDYNSAAVAAPSSAVALYGRALAAQRLGHAGPAQADFTAANGADAGVAALYSAWGLSAQN